MFFSKANRINDLEIQVLYLKNMLAKERKELEDLKKHQHYTRDSDSKNSSPVPTRAELDSIVQESQYKLTNDIKKLVGCFMPVVGELIIEEAEAGLSSFTIDFGTLCRRVRGNSELVELIHSVNARVKLPSDPTYMFKAKISSMPHGYPVSLPSTLYFCLKDSEANDIQLGRIVIEDIALELQKLGYSFYESPIEAVINIKL